MKKCLLFVFLLVLGTAVMAQSHKINTKYSKGNAVPAVVLDNPISPVQLSNTAPLSKSALEETLGETRYDLQSNAGTQNRLVYWPDGTISATWIKGQVETSYADRGTAYNYYDGSAWGPQPTGRIESVRTGWPSIDKWNGNGEIIISHQSGTTPLVMNTRPVKGTGAWTQTLISAPAGAAGLLWPRAITSGPTNNYIHMVVLTSPTANGGTVYEGLDGALLYYRSLDGGATWDKNGIILPGLESANYDGFSADVYSWGSPQGDVIYFAVAGDWSDTFIMKSTDNGETWTKIPVLTNANKKLPTGTTYVPPFYSSDGAVAVEMDHNGIIHMAHGIGGGHMTDGTKYIYINRNGLVYWNTTMPMLPDSLDLDTLYAHGNLIGYYFDGPNPEDTLLTVPTYRMGLSSFPQLSIDAANNIYCLYICPTYANPSADDMNYRNIWGVAKFHDKAEWTDMINLNEGILYWFYEFVYVTMAKSIPDDNLRIIYQTSETPGSSSVSGSTIAVHNNNFDFRIVPGSTFWPPGVEQKTTQNTQVGQNYPNPVTGLTSFNAYLDRSSNVVIEVSNVMGQKIMTLDKGMINSGNHKFTIDCNRLTSGIYFYTVKINGESYTRKMIIE